MATPQTNIEPCSVVHGDRSVRGFKITCGKCATVERLPYNNPRYSRGFDDDVVQRKIESNFECRGWKIGKRRRDNRCPACIRRGNATLFQIAVNGHQPTEKPMVNPVPLKHDKVELKTSTAIPAASMESEAIRAMSRMDRQAILIKLFEVYGDETTGYKAGWNDQKVATDMAVPVAWVSELREQNCGPLLVVDTTELEEWKKASTRLQEAIAAFERDQKTIVQEAKDTVARLSSALATFSEEAKRLRGESNRLLVQGQAIDRKLNR